MLRVLFITLLNMALPFLLWWLRIYLLRVLMKHRNKKQEKTLNLPPWNFPILKLFLAGLILLTLSLSANRVFIEADTSWKTGNKARTEDF